MPNVDTMSGAPRVERTSRARSRSLPFLVPLGRVLFASIFLISGPGHFSRATIGYAASQGVPLASVLVPIAGILAIAGGLSVAIGVRARLGAWLLVIFLVPVTLTMHAFWRVADPMMAMNQQIHFMKNVVMLGGALLITWFGAGPYSVDGDRP